jgi:hypothetical protein
MFDIQAQASKQLNKFGQQLPSDTKLKSSAQNKSCMEQLQHYPPSSSMMMV